MKTNPKILIVYYSRTKNNQFIAEKLANAFNADMEVIRPRIQLFPFLLILTSLGKSIGIKRIKADLKDYDRIVLLGPIWFGMLVSPLKTFLKTYYSKIQSLYFISCCGTSDELKDEKFGYTPVFNTVKGMLGDKCKSCFPISMSLVLPEDLKNDQEEIMKARITEENYQAFVASPLQNIIKSIQS